MAARPGQVSVAGHPVGLLEFAPGFEDPNWCTRGHIIYVLEGVLELGLDGDSAELVRVAAAFAAAGPTNLREIAAVGGFEGLRPQDAARALSTLAARSGDADQSLGVLIAQHSLALERGRPREALELTRQMQRLAPATRAHLRLRVLDALFGDGDSTAAAAAARELHHTAANPDLVNAAADACALAQWQLAHMDTAGARVSLGLLPSTAPDPGPVPVGAPSPACRGLVEASLAVSRSG